MSKPLSPQSRDDIADITRAATSMMMVVKPALCMDVVSTQDRVTWISDDEAVIEITIKYRASAPENAQITIEKDVKEVPK